MTESTKAAGKTRAKKAAPSFDEAAYRDELVAAGLDIETARTVAATTGRLRADALAKSAHKANLIKSGVAAPAAARLADAAHRFNALPADAVPSEILDHTGRPLAGPRVDGMRSFSDIIGAGAPATGQTSQPSAAASAPAPATAPDPAPDPDPAPAAAPAAKKKKQAAITPVDVYDYRNGTLPDRVRDLIETHLAIEAEDAKSAGTLGFMTRSLAIATLPHRSVNDFRFVRKNGDFTLTMMTAHPQGLPYGTIPRLLLTWVCTEVAQKRERVLNLGHNLAAYLDELGLHNSGGKRGDITRLKHAMTTLFSSVISCHYDGKDSFALQNVLLADRVDWWTPQNPEEAGEWQSNVMLSEPFFKECIDHKLPFDMRAIRSLRTSPLALDIYIWMTHRMSYLSKRTTIPWISLAGQFGSSYADNDQGLRDFRRAFLRELKHVLIIYPQAKVSHSENGLVMYPSPTHIAPSSVYVPKQSSLSF
ncbi:replication protein RepA [Massilia sp. DWR3-1-1]|uniref:replication protein RepA n=1 Tax=Massilia sp. DWR3-1-1 TaxID=2804559 RepID=UPI003CE6FCD6